METTLPQTTSPKAGAAGKVFAETEPLGSSVDGADLLQQLADEIQRHVVLPTGAVEAIALWVVFTYTIDAFDIAPILAILSPVKGCGKTTLLLILRALVWRPQVTSNISSAALFRIIDKYHPALLIDEIDTQLSEDLRGILNAGHTRSGAKAIRCDGAAYEPRVFDVWSAKALAGIGKLPPTVQDRAVTIAMRRRLPDEHVDRLRQDRIEQQFELHRSAVRRWANDHVSDLRDADPRMPDGLTDRAADNWRTLLAIADAAGGIWPKRARRAALLLNQSPAVEEDDRTLLLADIRQLFEAADERFFQTKTILRHLNDLDERPWSTFTHGGQLLTPSGLARLLQPFGVSPSKRRDGKQFLRGYDVADLQDAFDRYLSPEAATGATGATAATENLENTGRVAGVAGVAGSRRVGLRRPKLGGVSLQIKDATNGEPDRHRGRSHAAGTRTGVSLRISRQAAHDTA